ncbi:hypothetical protein AB3K25_02410 [Leuconostoc sp. MS02]|uniref:Integral membrane protein n=1 Tax=Leuconostoc aquikimchii TaxID=3236804 RepID=A0ABV3S448_9LACO
MDSHNNQQQSHRLPDGRPIPRRITTDPQEKRSYENFTPAGFFDWRRWVPLLVIVISLNLVWWRQPLLHTKALSGAAITWQLIPLFGYTVTIAIAITLMMTQNFRSILSYLFVALSMLFTFSSLIQTRHEVFILLLLFSAFFIAVQQTWIGLQNWLGLLLLSVLATFAIPVSIFYITNNFLTQRFIWQLLPMLFGFGFYFTPILMPNPDGRKLSILTLGLFWVTLLSHTVDVSTIFIIIFSLFAFILQFVKARIGNWQHMGYVLMLALSMLLIYH